jgi:hypothetical protein
MMIVALQSGIPETLAVIDQTRRIGIGQPALRPPGFREVEPERPSFSQDRSSIARSRHTQKLMHK